MGIRDRLRLLVRGDGRPGPRPSPGTPSLATAPRPETTTSRDTTATTVPPSPRRVSSPPVGARLVTALDAAPGPVCAVGPDEELAAALAEAFAARGVSATWAVAP